MESQSSSNNFFSFTTSRPVTVTMITIAFLLFGWLSYDQLSLNLMPDISYPSLTVRTEFPGTAPEEIETAISRPVEEALGVVADLTAISSISKAGQSDVILEYNWDVDMIEAIGEVREKLDRVFLPEDANKPIILKYDPSLDPILRLGLTGGPDLYVSRNIAEENIKRALETVPGVASVRVKGGYEEEIRVELNEKQISLMGLDIQQIRQRLSEENVNLAGGELQEGQTEYIVRTLNEFRTVAEIAEIKLGFQNNREVRLADIGQVYRTYKERQILTRLNEEESVELEVYKEGDANIVEVAERVRDKVFGTEEQQAYVAEMREKEKKKDDDKEESAQQGGQGRGGPGGGGFQDDMIKRAMTNYLAYSLPSDMNLALLSDQSVFIENSIDDVKSTAIWGGVFAVIVLLLFLNKLSTTVIVGLAIPISILATFTPMNLFEVSLNIMSLGGLALGIGMLVDNSIVVIESIFRCREEGDDFVESVIRGTGEVGSAVTASTLTTIAVFFPMIFVEGIAGQIFGDLALTVVFSLLASLAVALFFIPMLASRRFISNSEDASQETLGGFYTKVDFLGDFRDDVKRIFNRYTTAGLLKQFLLLVPTIVGFIVGILVLILRFSWYCFSRTFNAVLMVITTLVGLVSTFWTTVGAKILAAITNRFNRLLQYIAQRYTTIIDWALTNRSTVLAGALVPFIITVFVLLPQLGSELIPEVRQGEFTVELTLPIGTPVEITADIISPIEQMILEQDEVSQISTVVGVDLTKINDSEAGEHTASITVGLKANDDMRLTEDRVLNSIRSSMENYSGIAYKISRPVLFSFKTPVEVEIRGYNLTELALTSRDAVAELSRVDGLTDVKSSLQRGNPEVQIVYDRNRLAYHDLNIMTVASLVRNKVRGDVATEFKKEDRRIDVLVRVRDEDKATIDRLKLLNVNPGGEVPITLESVARIEIKEGPSEIRRIDQERTALITANIAERSLSDVSEDVFATMANMDLPEGFSFEITGQNKEMEVSLNSLQLALLLAIFMVYIVMASQFESFIHPLVILFTVPFGLIGVVLILWVLGIPMNIMVFLGLIMLAGIVVNNAIVLVDYINQLRNKGMKKREAIIEAGKARLRPILMTTMTTVLGLLPMAIGFGEGAEIRTPMAITVIAGLISATVLTLVVIPTVYAIFTGSDEVEATASDVAPADDPIDPLPA